MDTRKITLLLTGLLFTLFASAQTVPVPTGIIHFQVSDGVTKKPVTGVKILIKESSVNITEDDKAMKTKSDSLGNLELRMLQGEYRYILRAKGYEDYLGFIMVLNRKTTFKSITLIPKTTYSNKEGTAEPDLVIVEMDEDIASESMAVVKAPKILHDAVGFMSASSAYTSESSGGMSVKPEVGSGFTQKAGQLTAGQLNDFAKWRLWSDLSDSQLKEHASTWGMKTGQRYSVLVRNKDDFPVVSAEVRLVNRDRKILWATRTDNTGQAELWPGLLGGAKDVYRIEVVVEEETYPIKSPIPFDQGVNLLRVDAKCGAENSVDIAFVVDATGSMGDEIAYLKAELKDVMERALKKHPDRVIRLGSVFYRDASDAYLTQHTPLTSKYEKTIEFIKKQSAAGGGDYPEAVDAALEVAINKLEWNEQARARIAFLVLDAPPHNNGESRKRMEESIKEAARKGIRIIPVTASGVDKSTEYLMRCLALSTNGTYTFLTNHSGIGGDHIEPTTDSYDVELLNDLLLRLIDEYSFVPDCNQRNDETPDTLQVLAPKIIEHEIINDLWVVQYADSHVVRYDTTNFLPVATLPGDDTTQLDNELPEKVESALFGMKIYPNPVYDQMTIQFKGRAKELHIADLSGKILRYYADPGEQVSLSMLEYPVGQYLVIAWTGEEKVTGKVIVVH
ncbi:VWA domain-containing protein [bacterium SCSIO 12741]|nr:VWA domain-containing protein [bacterium SCSIO 12741]